MKKSILSFFLLLSLAIQTEAQKTNFDGKAVIVTPVNLGDTAVQLTFSNLPFPGGALPNSYGFYRYFYESDKATACVGAQMTPMAYRPPNFYNECGASLCANEWACVISLSNMYNLQPFTSITVPYNKSVGNCGIATNGETHTYRWQLTYTYISGMSFTIYETSGLIQLTAPFISGTPDCGSTGPVFTPADPAPASTKKGNKPVK